MTRFVRWLGIELSEVSAAEKLIATLGGGLSILVLMTLSRWVLSDTGAAAVVASIGASAVLLFAVPHGQLSQPWPAIGGHGVSAAIGVGCAHFIPEPHVAAACAVGLAIGGMHQLKCIHPPGGATAFTAVLINCAFKWRRYPAIFSRSSQKPLTAVPGGVSAPTHAEIIAALKSIDSFVDITEEDLLCLVEVLSHRPRRSV